MWRLYGLVIVFNSRLLYIWGSAVGQRGDSDKMKQIVLLRYEYMAELRTGGQIWIIEIMNKR